MFLSYDKPKSHCILCIKIFLTKHNCCLAFQRWKNELLTWKRENYNGVKIIRIDPSLVWIPDIVLYNRFVKHSGSEGGYQ